VIVVVIITQDDLFRVIMINVPKWFSFVWRHVLSPLLDSSAKARTFLYGTDYLQALRDLIAVENIPEIYGGKCRCQGECRTSSEMELALAAHVKKYVTEPIERK